jgi:hypothetical protein
MIDEFAVAILTPSTGICRVEYAQSLARLIMYFAHVPVYPGVPRQNLITDTIIGSGIGANYETMVKKFLADETVHWTHFLSVEDDMVFAPNLLHVLASRRLPIVGAAYSTNKGTPLRFTAVGMNGVPFRTSKEQTGVEEVMRLPQGFTLIAREVYEKLPRPWFMVGYDQATETYGTQDYYFSNKAREAGFNVYADHDATKLIAHIGPRQHTWEEALAEIEQREKESCSSTSASESSVSVSTSSIGESIASAGDLPG